MRLAGIAAVLLVAAVPAQAQTIKDFDEASEGARRAYVLQRMMDVSPRAKRERIADRIYKCMMLMINTPDPSPLEQRRFMRSPTSSLYDVCHKNIMKDEG